MKERRGREESFTKHLICGSSPKYMLRVTSALPSVLQLWCLTNPAVVRHLQALHFNAIEDNILWMFQPSEAEAHSAVWLDPLHRDQKQAMLHLLHLPSKISLTAKLQPLLRSWYSSIEGRTEDLLRMGYKGPQQPRCPSSLPASALLQCPACNSHPI